MKLVLIWITWVALLVSCNRNHKEDNQGDHNHEENHETHSHEDDQEDHDHEMLNPAEQTRGGHDEDVHFSDGDQHEEIKFKYTAYSNEFELFAEADPFIAGEKASLLSHFSVLPAFKALEEGEVTVILRVNGKEVRQTLNEPTRKGIYRFIIQPETAGTGTLKFRINKTNGPFELVIPGITVFANHEQVHKATENIPHPPETNTFVFTKEQTWKIDFSTAYPGYEPFGQVIKTVAKIDPVRSEELIISAKADGMVVLTDNELVEGKDVVKGRELFSISSGETAKDNMAVLWAEAKSNYETSKRNYERKAELVKDKLVSEQEMLAAKNAYETAKAVYDNLVKNFNTDGQAITSPVNGFVRQIFVTNGQYVRAGQPLVSVAGNRNLQLTAYVQQKYLDVLPRLVSANIKTLYNNKIYSLEELNGKILAYGRAATENSFLLPVHLQIAPAAHLVPGTLTEVFLKSATEKNVLTVPDSAILEEQGIYYVFVQITPELFEKREVKTGVSDGKKTEIREGIKSGERIVTQGAMHIKLAQSTGALDAHSGHVH